MGVKIVIMCLTLIVVPAQVQSKATTDKGAIFTRIGTVYTGLAYGHLHLRYNISNIVHRTSQLQTILSATSQIVAPKKATISDRYFLDWTKDWAKEEITETIEKVQEALYFSSGPDRQRRSKRPKRQVLIGIATATLGAIAGSIISSFSTNSMNDVIKQRQNVLVSTVKDNLISINQNQRDIKNLENTLKLVINDTRRYIVDARRNTYGITHLQMVMTIQQTCRSLKDAINTIEAARTGKFYPSLADHKGLIKALKQLRNKAVRKGYELSIETSMDMKDLPCTTAIEGQTLHVVVHIPLYQSALDLDLYRYVDHPVQQLKTGLYASIDMDGEPTFLGISVDESKYKEFSSGDLEACYQRDKRYFCPDVALYSGHRPNCLWALYKNNINTIRNYCKVSINKLVARAVRIDENRFMVTDTAQPNTMTLSCGEEVPQRRKINGTEILEINRGCRVTTTHVSISHPHFEPEVDIEGLVINDELSFNDWIPTDQEEEFGKTATELLQRIGEKVPWSQVATLTEFKAHIKTASKTLPAMGIIGWVLHLLPPIMATFACVTLVYCFFKVCLPQCRHYYQQHQQKSAAIQLNRVRHPSANDEEPMDIDLHYDPTQKFNRK